MAVLFKRRHRTLSLPPALIRSRPRQMRRKLRIGKLLAIRHTLQLTQSAETVSSAILAGALSLQPVSFARTPQGDVFMANGFMPMSKWDGIRYAAQTVGVFPPSAAPTLGFSGSGSITGTYTAYVRFVDEDGNVSNLSPVSNSIAPVNAGKITYSGVPAPTESKVARRQILRNTSGQALTYYVDLDTTDLVSTSFSSVRSDTDLLQQDKVALFDSVGNSLANRFTVPPNNKPILVAYLDRMFALGSVTYNEGHCEVTTGSALVYGRGTEWPAVLAGRAFYPLGAGRIYGVLSVDVMAQTLTLDEPYQEGSDQFLTYAIRPSPGDARTINFSEAGLYEAWPATNGLTIEENGDENVGGVVSQSFLFLLQRRHIYRLTFEQDPNKDGGIFFAANRGCVNNRSWLNVEGVLYLLDQQGVYAFSGEVENISAAIQDLFWLDHPQGEKRINWFAQKLFHALYSKDEALLRWFVCLSGERLPRHALVYNLVHKCWGLEEYAFPIPASVTAETLKSYAIVSGPSRMTFKHATGSLDGPDPAKGTTRGLVTSAGPVSLLDALAGFSDLVNAPVTIVQGRGKGQIRLVTAVANGRVDVAAPWLVQPDETSVYQLGGVNWTWFSGTFRWLREEGEEQRRLEVIFSPTEREGLFNIRLYAGLSLTPQNWGVTWPTTKADRDGVQTREDLPDAEVSTNLETGFAQLRLADRRERYLLRADYITIEVAGVAGCETFRIYSIQLEGADNG